MYKDMDAAQREQELKAQLDAYRSFKAKGLSLNMARGKPSARQLDLSTPMLGVLACAEDCFSEDGTDCRNYGVIDGIPEAKRLMATMLDEDPENVVVLGNSSLTAMHDAIARCLDFGCLGSKPWAECESVKFVCPVPGYDRHFAILEQFGIGMIAVPMLDDGPDMDEVERIVGSDPCVKGIWCVPKYSNPSGVTYSDDVVRRLAHMDCAAEDFRIFWDNAYCVHHLYMGYENQDHLLDIGIACVEAGNPDRFLKFASTSKVTFPGAGICALAGSAANVAEARKLLGAQMIGGDKLNQLRHGRHNQAEVRAGMEKAGRGPRRGRHRVVDETPRRILRVFRRIGRHSQAHRAACQGSRRGADIGRSHVALRQRPHRQQHPHRAHDARARRAFRSARRLRVLRQDRSIGSAQQVILSLITLRF